MISHLELNSINLLLQFDINPIQDGSFCSFSQMEKRVLGKKKKTLPLKIILGNVIAISMISMKLEKHFWLDVIGHLLHKSGLRNRKWKRIQLKKVNSKSIFWWMMVIFRTSCWPSLNYHLTLQTICNNLTYQCSNSSKIAGMRPFLEG